ncbi:hypothetical protein NPIL_159101 [Nephila pilipes]|uniref:Uncharacterized protein n=1 Tax=Nephila pilipes TaxID=299642 RepID=A0A8X6NHD5_NEPPI|nr:hypothetical protein NPIL_159101 [Nephila pilipes]
MSSDVRDDSSLHGNGIAPSPSTPKSSNAGGGIDHLTVCAVMIMKGRGEIKLDSPETGARHPVIWRKNRTKKKFMCAVRYFIFEGLGSSFISSGCNLF